MKKSLIALAVLAASGAAMAQSNVTLYGVIDMAYGQTKSETTKAGVVTTKKTTGMFDGGSNGLATSRWGIRGSEDLGNGLKANFNLEQRINANDGTQNGSQLFKGRSVVGLSGDFGAVTLGREYTPIYSLADVVAVDGLGNKHHTNNLANTIERRDNAITYTSPSFSGVQVKAQIGQQKFDSNGAATKSQGFGVTAAYVNGPLVVGAGYDSSKDDTATSTSLIKTETNKVWAIGGSYDLGAAKLFADYVNAKLDAGVNGAFGPFSTVPAGTKATELNAGVRVPFGAATFIAGVGRNKVDNSAIALSQTGTDYMLGADYALSKRTTTYARVSQYNKYDSGKNQGFAIGLKHAF